MLCLGVGTIGIFIPVLPTTPLFLAAAWFFARSSKKIHNWLLYHPIMGQYIRDYIEKRGVQHRVRQRALLILWSSLILTMILIQKTSVTVILCTIGSLVSLYILSLQVLPATTGKDLPEEA